MSKFYKIIKILGRVDHFLNTDKISDYRLFNKIVNNFVKKSGQKWLKTIAI